MSAIYNFIARCRIGSSRHFPFALIHCLSLLLPLSTRAQSLEPIQYRNPNLVVDLAVGLWAWPIPWDVDGDGHSDLIVACPDKPHNGIWLFKNISGDTRSTPLSVFAPPVKLSHAVHYVMPSYVENTLRVLTPGTEHPGFVDTGISKRLTLSVPANFYKPSGPQTKGPKVRHNQWRYVDYNGDGRLDLVVGIEDWSHYGWDDAWNESGVWTNGPLHGFVHIFNNTGSNDAPVYADPFLVMAGDKPVDTFGMPTPNFTDFDGDGDLDLLCGEFLDGFTYFENVGSRTEPRYAPGRPVLDPEGRRVRMDLQMIVPIAYDWNRDGHPDLIVGDEDGRVAFVENTGQLDEHRTPTFIQPQYFKQQAHEINIGALATVSTYDWDADGDLDILAGNTAGYLLFIENLSGPGVAQPRWAAPVKLKADGQVIRIQAGSNGSIQGPAEAKWGYTTLSVADWDGDSLPDIVVNSILGRVMWFRNIGTKSQPKLDVARPVEVAWESDQPTLAWGWLRPDGPGLLTQWRTTPVAIDWNKDGLCDLVMLDHEGYLALFERQLVEGRRVLLPPRPIFHDLDSKPLQLNNRPAGGSGRRKITVVDWDGDGRLDILVNSQNARWLRQVDSTDGNYRFEDRGNVSERNIEGHDTSPSAVDFDGNGIPDLLIGAEDGRIYHLTNPH